MKGLILTAGKGSRMKGIRHNKCLGIVGGKSLVSHSVDRLLLMGIDDIVVVVGDDGATIKNHLDEYKTKAKITYTEQKVQLGIVDAIKSALYLIDKEDFVLCLGDEIFADQKPRDMLDFFISSETDCLCGVVPDETEEEIRKCYSVLLDADDNIKDMTEKPDKPFNTFKGTGFCIFRNRTLQHIGKVTPNVRSGQYDLCDWIKLCIAQGMKCKAYCFATKEFNINTLEDLRSASMFFTDGGGD